MINVRNRLHCDILPVLHRDSEIPMVLLPLRRMMMMLLLLLLLTCVGLLLLHEDCHPSYCWPFYFPFLVMCVILWRHRCVWSWIIIGRWLPIAVPSFGTAVATSWWVVVVVVVRDSICNVYIIVRCIIHVFDKMLLYRSLSIISIH